MGVAQTKTSSTVCQSLEMASLLAVVVLYFVCPFTASDQTLSCSGSHACPGDVISCQCQDAQTMLLSWRVSRPGDSTPLFSYLFATTQTDPFTMGAYSTILNSTNPISSQLTVILTPQEPQLLIQCAVSIRLLNTLYTVEALPGRPTNLQLSASPVSSTSNLTVTLRWDPPMEDAAAAITGYLINITELVTGLTQTLSSSNTTVTTQLNTAGEYLAKVVAVNCAGTSLESATILFNITEECLMNNCERGSTSTSSSTTTTTINSTNDQNSREAGGTDLFSATSSRPTATVGCMENECTPVESWHIGVAVACIVVVQIACTAICVTTTVVLKTKTAKGLPSPAMDMPPPRHTEHVQSEGRGQGDPTYYEDILPHAKEEEMAIELEENAAYSTTTTNRR